MGNFQPCYILEKRGQINKQNMEYKYTRKYEFRENQINGKRVKRVVKLIKFMREWRSISECAEHIEVKNRTVNRYIHLIIELGLEIRIAYRKPLKYKICNYNEFFETV
jgi:hypothetical protein